MIGVMASTGSHKTTEWPFIAFLLCLVFGFIHHSAFLSFHCIRLDLYFSYSVCLSVCVQDLSLIKTLIDNLSGPHQWDGHYWALLCAALLGALLRTDSEIDAGTSKPGLRLIL